MGAPSPSLHWCFRIFMLTTAQQVTPYSSAPTIHSTWSQEMGLTHQGWEAEEA